VNSFSCLPILPTLVCVCVCVCMDLAILEGQILEYVLMNILKTGLGTFEVGLTIKKKKD